MKLIVISDSHGNGIGVEKDLDTALEYYTMAAEQDNEGAREAVTRVQKQLDEEK